MEVDKDVLWHVLDDEEASTYAEYGLIFVLIALLVFLSVFLTGEGISDLFQRTDEAFAGGTIPTIACSSAYSLGETPGSICRPS